MNIQINTSEKTIKLSETVSLKELEDVLFKLFPNNEWREYKLETNTVIYNWSSPIIIERDNYPFYPYWYNKPSIQLCGSGGISTCSAGSNTLNHIPTFTSSQSEGLYNFSIN